MLKEEHRGNILQEKSKKKKKTQKLKRGEQPLNVSSREDYPNPKTQNKDQAEEKTKGVKHNKIS